MNHFPSMHNRDALLIKSSMYDIHITYENYKTYILKTFTPETKSFSVKGEHEGKCGYTSNWLNS